MSTLAFHHQPPAVPSSIFLEQGEIRATAHAEIISTILGSCVSVCLFDPSHRTSGMNHFLLAQAGDNAPSPRYGDIAIEQLIAAMIEIGANRSRLVAKIFGGGAVLPLAEPQAFIGRDNIRVAIQELARHRIPVIAQSTGGTQGLMIKLLTATGEVFAKKLGRMDGQV